MIVEVVNPTAKIHLELDSELPKDDYHSDNKDWQNLLGIGLLNEDSIREQISRVAGLKI
jgi:hypothetical protein